MYLFSKARRKFGWSGTMKNASKLKYKEEPNREQNYNLRDVQECVIKYNTK